jgi:hypothetical protein
MAAELNISADKRVPFVDDVVFIGPSWVGAAFLMHVRNNPGDTGSPLIALTAATAGTQGISVTFDATYDYVLDGVSFSEPASILKIQIDEGTIEALTLGTPCDKELTLAYDLHVTPSGGIKARELYGQFIINPGVTI